MKKTIKILLLTLIAIAGISVFSNVNAASANVKTSKTQATVGDKVTITVTINAAAWDVKATGAVSGHYVDNTDDLQNKTTTKTINLDTSTTGSKTVVLSGDVTDQSGATTNVNSTVTVVVSAPASQPSTPANNGGGNSNNNQPSAPAKSTDTGLKSVTVDGKAYTIGKSITVGADTSTVTIKATTNSSKAKVTGTGTKELVTGTNKFTLKVTAESGATKSYTVTVIREEYVEDEPNIIDPEPTEEINLRLTSLTAEGATLSPEFNSEVFEYSTDIVNLNEIKLNAIANIEDANIEVIGNTELKEGINVVLIKVTKGDKQAEYKINVKKTVEIIEEVKEDTNEEKKVGFLGSIKNWWNKSGPMTVVLGITLLLLAAAVMFAIISYKYGNNAKVASKHGRAQYIADNSDTKSEK